MSESDVYEVQPTAPVHGSIRPPGSKSITNRALICAALADGTSRLTGALDSEDTQVMIAALSTLGIDVATSQQATEVSVVGSGGNWPQDDAELYLANSGTSIRFLTAMVALGKGTVKLDGIARMRQRPIQHLVDGLNSLGAGVTCDHDDGCPPVTVSGKEGLVGGVIHVKGNISSQFLSALLMVAPCAVNQVEIHIDGMLVSRPYVDMTCQVMREFGVEVDCLDGQVFRINSGQRYKGRDYSIEPDASAASYFWGAAAITDGDVLVEGLQPDALQGDVGFCECLKKMGCEVIHEPGGMRVIGRAKRGIDVDMADISDTVQTLAVVALFVEGPTRIRGVAHNRHKETDRIGDLATELRKLGATVEEHDDGLTIVPGRLRGAVLETYGDHRMAMSLALAGLKESGVKILNPDCTSKTYPHFFQDLERLTTKPSTL